MDLTPYLHSGENELTVKVDNHADLPVYPAQADFTFFGGLYRQVELLIFADKAHFNVTEYGADSLLLTPDVETGTVQASVLCDGGDRLTLTVKDPDGTVVAQEETPVTGQKRRFVLPCPTCSCGTARKTPACTRLPPLCARMASPLTC